MVQIMKCLTVLFRFGKWTLLAEARTIRTVQAFVTPLEALLSRSPAEAKRKSRLDSACKVTTLPEVRMAKVRLYVSGDLACFTRPENKVERTSYPLPTPSAARNILDSVCWRPEMRWIVTSIALGKHPSGCNALPRSISLKRNEVQSTIGPNSVASWMRDPSSYRPQAAGAGEGTDGTPRMTVALKNVAYIIEAYPHVFDFNGGGNTPQKYIAMFERCAAKGQCHAQPYFGCREFAAEFRLATEQDKPVRHTESLGRMLYDIAVTPTGRSPVFFHAELKDGVMDTHPDRVLHDHPRREEVLACSYRR